MRKFKVSGIILPENSQLPDSVVKTGEPQFDWVSKRLIETCCDMMQEAFTKEYILVGERKVGDVWTHPLVLMSNWMLDVHDHDEGLVLKFCPFCGNKILDV